MNAHGTSFAPLVGNLPGLLAGFALLAAILAVTFLSSLGEERTVLGAAVMLVPLFSAALGSALSRDDRSLLGRNGLAMRPWRAARQRRSAS